MTEGIGGCLPARFISSVFRLDGGTQLWPTVDAAVNLAVQREQVDKAYEDVDKLEDDCLKLAGKIYASDRADDVSKGIAQSAMNTITGARAEEEAPDQSVHLQLAQMSVEVPELEEVRPEPRQPEGAEQQHQEQQQQQQQQH